MMGPYRNHPVSLLKGGLLCAFISIIAIISSERFELGLIGVVGFYFVFRVWHRTTYSFSEEGIDVTRSTAFKADTNIPYSKIASINLVRSVLDRIFGTVTVSFNINSGVNAASPEVSLILNKAKAEELKVFVESKIHPDMAVREEIPEEDRVYVTFSDIEVITHSFISMPTGSILTSIVFFAYSIVALTQEKSGSSGMFAMIIFLITMGAPVVNQLLRYFNFTAYRSGDTIFLEHGLLQTYHSSFDIHRINAVRVKSPLFARLLRRSSIQAEVVGINAMASDATPTLCLMTSNAHNRWIMQTLLPEFADDFDITLQPKEASRPLFFKGIAYSAITAIIAAIFVAAMMSWKNDIIDQLGNSVYVAIIACGLALAAISVFANIYGCIVSLRRIGYHFGEEKFVFVYGVVDRETTIMQYDRVQMAEETSGPVSRHYGLAQCEVSFLSALGNVGKARSGYMTADQARYIGDTVMARIQDGRYDYKKNEI